MLTEIERDLFERVLERMRLINGPEQYCLYKKQGDCPNHKIMRDIEEFVLRESSGVKG